MAISSKRTYGPSGSRGSTSGLLVIRSQSGSAASHVKERSLSPNATYKQATLNPQT